MNKGISINVYGHEKCEQRHSKKSKNQTEGVNFFPIRISENCNSEHEINLLLLRKGGKRHYILINSMSRLLRRSYTNGNNTIFPCRYCLTCFYKPNLLKTHLTKC